MTPADKEALKLTDAERAMQRAASAGLDALMAEWKRLGLPPEGVFGMLMAQVVAVGLRECGLSFPGLVRNISRCLGSMLEPNDDTNDDDDKGKP